MAIALAVGIGLASRSRLFLIATTMLVLPLSILNSWIAYHIFAA